MRNSQAVPERTVGTLPAIPKSHMSALRRGYKRAIMPGPQRAAQRRQNLLYHTGVGYIKKLRGCLESLQVSPDEANQVFAQLLGRIHLLVGIHHVQAYMVF